MFASTLAADDARAQGPSPAPAQAPSVSPAAAPTLASLLAATRPSDWRPLDPENTLYLDLPGGRVVQGIEVLSTLPRGSGRLGVYEQPEQRVPIRALRVAADVPAGERVALEVLRTESAAFTALVEARRYRREEWFKRPSGRVELCNVPIPVRPGAR